MEVHPHSHTDPAHGETGRKKFKHYLWEFLMLFLAVFCGFLAENLRELKVEHDREKQFMITMTEDILKDTVMLTSASQRALFVVNNIDTALNTIQNQKFDNISVYALYRVNLGMLANFSPGFTDRTSVQLKNSGGMRLIRKENVADGIIDYWNKTDLLIAVNALLDDYKIKAREKTYTIFNQKYYSIRREGTYVNQPDPKLMTTDLFQLTELANRLSHIRSLILNVYIPQLKAQEEIAKKLIVMIKKEYHLQ